MEDKGQQFPIDSSTGVGDNKFGVRIGSLQADLYAPAVGSEFDRVREKVPEHLLQAVEGTAYRSRGEIDERLDADRRAFGRRPHHLKRPFDDRASRKSGGYP